jgi:hypothetical protein
MSSWEELVPSVGQHDDFWRNNYAASQCDPDDIVTTRRRAKRLLEEQAGGNSTEQPAEQRLSSAA